MDGLTVQDCCPWCGGVERVPFDGVTTDENFYIDALEETARLSEGSIRDVPTFRCTNCAAIYLSSFFDDLTVGEAFSIRTSSHNAGWMTFHSRSGLLPEARIEKQKKKDSTKQHILELVPEGEGVYVEVGCPFAGLIHEVAFGPGNEDVVASRYARYLGASAETNPAAFGLFVQPMKGLLPFVARQFLRLLTRRAGEKALPDPQPPKGRKDVYLVKPDSRFIWNDNCTSNFATCTATALAVYGVKRIRMEEIAGVARGRPLTIGFFNTLDHLEGPRALLEQAVELADQVIIETHGYEQGGGRQHLFFLNETIPVWGKRMGWVVEDRTPDILAKRKQYKNYLYVISKG